MVWRAGRGTSSAPDHCRLGVIGPVSGCCPPGTGPWRSRALDEVRCARRGLDGLTPVRAPAARGRSMDRLMAPPRPLRCVRCERGGTSPTAAALPLTRPGPWGGPCSRPGQLSGGSVPCSHDRRPKGRCHVGSRPSCGTSVGCAGRADDGIPPSRACQAPVRPICVGSSAPARCSRRRKKRSGTGRGSPMARSGGSRTRRRPIDAVSRAVVMWGTSAIISKPCCTPCPRRAPVSCVLS